MELIVEVLPGYAKTRNYGNHIVTSLILVLFCGCLYLAADRFEEVYTTDTPIKADVSEAGEIPEHILLLENAALWEAAAPRLPGSLDTVENIGITTERRKERRVNLILPVSGVAEDLISTVSEPDVSIETPVNEPVLPASVKFVLHGNGGTPELAEEMFGHGDVDLSKLPTPERLGKLFDGWYLDEACTAAAERIDESAETMELYAGWKEFPGFISNDLGHITACTGGEAMAEENMIILPHDKMCTGLERGCFKGLEHLIDEIYINEYITYIGEGTLEDLPNLFWIEVNENNPVYKSINGVLYTKDGETELVFPNGRPDRQS